jgi:hypothetical protein
MCCGIEKHAIGSFKSSEHAGLGNVSPGCLTGPFNSAEQEFDATASVTPKSQNLSCNAQCIPPRSGRKSSRKDLTEAIELAISA